jgi:flagellar biosynthesis protein FliR
MKKLRNAYLIAGLGALVFALLTKLIPGVTVTDFVQGFCYGLAVSMLVAGLITSTIPYFYRNEKRMKKTPDPVVAPEPTEPEL